MSENQLGRDFRISLEFNEREFKRAEQYLKEFPKQMPKLIAESMNRAVGAMQTEVLRGIAKRYNLTQIQVRKHVSVHKASANSFAADVTISDSIKTAWHLYDFKVSPRRVQRRSKGVKVSVLRSGGVSMVHSFIAQMRSGHIGVFERTREARRAPIKNSDKGTVSPIKELFSPTPAVMASQSVVEKEVEARGYEVFEKRMDHVIDYLKTMR